METILSLLRISMITHFLQNMVSVSIKILKSSPSKKCQKERQLDNSQDQFK